MDIIEIDRGDEPIVKAAQKRKRSVTSNNDQTDPTEMTEMIMRSDQVTMKPVIWKEGWRNWR